MSTLLLVKSSIFGAQSKSSEVAEDFVRAWVERHPGGTVERRDLGAAPISHITLERFGAGLTPKEQRSSEQHEVVAEADALIDELERADVIVIASPMYNFSISSNLKAWIDHVVRAGRTFRYTQQGRPEGLLKNKKVVVVTGRGGVYTEGPLSALDFQEPYLRTILGFVGLTDISFIHAEGLRVSPEAAAKGLERARNSIDHILASQRAA